VRASRDERAGKAVVFANGPIRHYLVDEQDLPPDSELGPLGLLDDAFLLHRHAANLLSTYPWLADVLVPYRVPLPDAFEFVRKVLPESVGDALERTSRTVLLMATALIGTSGTGGSASATRVSTRLRLAEAATLVSS
jgi:hypothetical protein